MAAVYDAAAAELLRLATHLAPDTAAAEDLLQATFLTAIEKAQSYDPKRGVQQGVVD